MSGLTVFLDYDGVLHPADVMLTRAGPMLAESQAGHALFEHAGALAELLARHADTRVVLATSWVVRFGFEYARSQLPQSLQALVVGATFDPNRDGAGFLSIARGYQIAEDARRRKVGRWVALDDEGAAWPASHRRRLIQTDPTTGLGDPAVMDRLQTALDDN